MRKYLILAALMVFSAGVYAAGEAALKQAVDNYYRHTFEATFVNGQGQKLAYRQLHDPETGKTFRRVDSNDGYELVTPHGVFTCDGKNVVARTYLAPDAMSFGENFDIPANAAMEVAETTCNGAACLLVTAKLPNSEPFAAAEFTIDPQNHFIYQARYFDREGNLLPYPRVEFADVNFSPVFREGTFELPEGAKIVEANSHQEWLEKLRPSQTAPGKKIGALHLAAAILIVVVAAVAILLFRKSGKQ